MLRTHVESRIKKEDKFVEEPNIKQNCIILEVS